MSMGRFLLCASVLLLIAVDAVVAAPCAFIANSLSRSQCSILPVRAQLRLMPTRGGTCRPFQGPVERQAVLDSELVNAVATTTGAFEPQLDVGALTGFVSIALVAIVFWGRVVVATDDRKKREVVKKRRRELLIKRITGMFRPGDEDALLMAEAEAAGNERAAWRQWFRGIRIVTEKTDSNPESHPATQDAVPPANRGNYTTNPFDN